jgi:hypothetical protein
MSVVIFLNDAPPSSLMDSITSPKVKIAEGEWITVRSLGCSTLGVEGHARALDGDEEDWKQVN